MHLWRAAMDLLPIKEEIRPAWRYQRLKKNQDYTLFQKYTITKGTQQCGFAQEESFKLKQYM